MDSVQCHQIYHRACALDTWIRMTIRLVWNVLIVVHKILWFLNKYVLLITINFVIFLLFTDINIVVFDICLIIILYNVA